MTSDDVKKRTFAQMWTVDESYARRHNIYTSNFQQFSLLHSTTNGYSIRMYK